MFAIVFGAIMIYMFCITIYDGINSSSKDPKDSKTITISKDMFEYYKKSWYREGYADGKYNRTKQV